MSRVNGGAEEHLRRRIRERARKCFAGDLPLLGHSPAVRRLERQLETAPGDWPLVIVAEAGSGVANWLIALHIAATEEPHPLRFVDVRDGFSELALAGDPGGGRREAGRRKAVRSGDGPRWAEETWALSRLDTLSAEQLDALAPRIRGHGRVLASAYRRASGDLGASRGGIDGSSPEVDPAHFTAAVGAATEENRHFHRAGFATVVELPPLRERPEDIPPLLRYFLGRYGFPEPLELTSAAFDRCLAYPWPGNERQLSRFAARLAGEHDGRKVGLEQLAAVAPQVLSSPSSSLHPALARAVRFISHNYDRPLTFAEVAEAAFTSTSHLSHLFKTELQTRFGIFLSELRVRHAQRMIRAQPDRPLELLAVRSGFSSLRQMERHFQRRVRRSPSAYRRTICRADQSF